MLTREELLAVAGVGVKTRPVKVEDVGEILLREFSGANRDEYFSRLVRAPRIQIPASVDGNGKDTPAQDVPDVAGLKAWAVSVAVRGPAGEPLFKDEKDANDNLSPAAIDAIFDVIAEENALTDARRAEKN